MKTGIGEYLAWLFLPSRFFLNDNGRRVLSLADFETLYFVDRAPHMGAVNKATGKVFLGGSGNEFLGALLGPQSVFLLDHERHRLARKIMGTVLTRQAAQRLEPAVDGIIREELDRVRNSQSVNVGAWTRFLAMRVICRTALGLEDLTTVRRLYKRMESTTGFLANIVSFRRSLWRDRGWFSIGGLVAFLVRRIDRELYALIEARRLQLDSSAPEAPETALDALLIAQAENGYDDAFIRDNLVALLAAGYDTSGSALTWMCHWLWHEHDVFADLLEAHKRGDSAPQENFRSEVLRYCPPIDILPRRIKKEFMDGAKDILPELGEMDASKPSPMVCPYVHRAHHDPEVYEQPDRFSPQRFGGERRYSPDEYMPFGASVRMCLGRNFGNLMMERLLHNMLDQGGRFKMSTRRFAPVRRNVSMWPAFSVRGSFVME